MSAAPRRRAGRWWWALGALVAVATAVFAWSRVGMLNLPAVPADLTAEAAGLAELEEMKLLDAAVWSEAPPDAAPPIPEGMSREAVRLVREGIQAVRRGEEEAGLERMRQGIRLEPDNLVLANAYRMVTFGLKRDYLKAALQGDSLAPEFPPHLKEQPVAFLKELDERRSTRETKLQLALAWVDHMLLFPALEIKAPASVESVDILTKIIDGGHPGYAPALLARGLNHLHRPARLVWPESAKTPKDAAVRDVALCVAVGRKFGAGSKRLQATLAVALGDAYVKAGRLNVARSWWQIAQNLCREKDVQQAVRRRYAWRDEEIVDRLEEELDRSRSELDRPMTDLSLMWN